MNRLTATMLNMFRTCKLVLTNNSGVWSGNLSAQTCYDEFEIALANLEGTVDAQRNKSNAFTSEKKKFKASMAELANVMRSKVQAWAAATSNTVKYIEMEITEARIMKAQANDARNMAQLIYTTANGMTAGDKTTYDISAAELTTLLAAINQFDAMINVPRQKISQRKGLTTNMKLQTKAIDKMLKTRMDKIVDGYKMIAFEFWLAYTDARVEVGPNYRIARIAGEAMDAITKQKLYAVKVTAVSKGAKHLTFEDMTDTEGQYVMRHISPEVYDITYEVPGYTPITKENVAISGGMHELISVELTPAN